MGEDKVKLYVAGDSGPSGFGVATKRLVKHLVTRDDILVTFRTHQWGWNDKGVKFESSNDFGDERFKHFIISNGYVNEDYICNTVEKIEGQVDQATPLSKELKDNRSVESQECMIRQFEGKEDVWLAVGGQNFAEHAPDDESIHTILSTDFNLDKVPHNWEYYLDCVDEVWVPSEWTYQSIVNRFKGYRDDLIEKTHWFHYGVNMNYRPTEYDCEACPIQHQSVNSRNDSCLRDEQFNFLVVSRFYHVKGVYRTLKAYLKEFDQEENVRLFFKTTSNQQFSFEPMKSIKQVINEIGKEDHPEIGVKKEPFDTQHMYDLYGHADAFIQASRAECFGIAQLQAAYCGTPVIYTNWSSQREVMDEDLPGMIPLEQYIIKQPNPESNAFQYAGANDFPRDSRWALPSIEELREKMRYVFESSKEERDEMGRNNTEYVRENYAWNEKVKPRVKRIKKGAGK